jgi:tripartite-type tricarboxylate transporter receptor subunit TctC
MNVPHRQFAQLAGVAVAVILLSLSGHVARSQATRIIKIIVPFTAGGPNDVLARLLAEQIGRSQGPKMVVENRPGAGAALGTEAVARAAPDGNTVLIVGTTIVVNSQLRKVNFDPLTSFDPICHLASAPMVLVVNSASPYHTLTDLLNAARSKPGDLTLASLAGSQFQIAFEMLKRAAKVDLTFVPFGGTPPAVNALLGEHVTSVFVDYSVVAELLTTGKLRAVVVFSPERIEPLPDVQTVAEAGYKDIEDEGWFGLFAPAKTPKEALSQLAGSFTAALRTPDIREKLAVQGIYPAGTCGADFSAFLRKQFDRYGRVIREAGIKAE